MRGLTIAVVAVAVVLIVGIALLVQRDDQGDVAGRVPGQAPAASGAKPATDQPASRSARVEDRLMQLRQGADRHAGGAEDSGGAARQGGGQQAERRQLGDIERRQLGEAGSLQPKRRDIPDAAARAAQQMQQPAAEDDDDEDEDDPEEVEKLKQTVFKNPDPDERIGAILMLTGDEGPESLRVLMEALDDPDAEVRLAVVEAIGDRAEDIVPGSLSGALRDPDAEVRFEAVSILGDMDDPEAMAMVRLALNDPDEDVRALAEGILDFSEDDDTDDEPVQPVRRTPQ
jgi:hypothetical protein